MKTKKVTNATRGFSGLVQTTLKVIKSTSETANTEDTAKLLNWLDMSRIFVPLFVMDISEKLAVNANYKLSLADIKSWEK